MKFNRIYLLEKNILILALLVTGTLALQAQNTTPVSISELTLLSLTENPVIQQNKLAVTIAKGRLRTQSGAFDYYFNSSASIFRNSHNLLPGDPRNNLTDGVVDSRGSIFSLGVSKMFRSGLVSDMRINYNSIRDNTTLNRFNEVAAPDITDHFMSSSFTLMQPLMRGRGKLYATASEKTAEYQLKERQTDMVYENSVQVLNVVTAYWEYLTRYNDAIIYQENEARVKKMLDITEDLIEGDKRPAGDLYQIKADLANQKRLSAIAQQAVTAARLSLGRAVGLNEAQSRLIGKPLDDFPSVEESGASRTISPESFIELAIKNRKDIESNEISLQALSLQMQLAQNNLKPQLNLLGTLNYGGTSIGNGFAQATNTFTGTAGNDIGIELGLTFDFPLNNNRAQGVYLENSAMLKGQEILTDNLSRNVKLNVALALNNLENSMAILRFAEEAYKYNLQVYEDEQTKFKNGLTTLLNLILFQERLTLSQLQYLQSKKQFAISVANLRFETGTLYTPKGSDQHSADSMRMQLLTIPQL